jgi:transcriptional regulator GlxA family with amidase domain
VRYRVQLAADILGERQRRPLDEIAVACGFASARRLAQAFTQHYGMPPGRFRGTVEAG